MVSTWPVFTYGNVPALTICSKVYAHYTNSTMKSVPPRHTCTPLSLFAARFEAANLDCAATVCPLSNILWAHPLTLPVSEEPVDEIKKSEDSLEAPKHVGIVNG